MVTMDFRCSENNSLTHFMILFYEYLFGPHQNHADKQMKLEQNLLLFVKGKNGVSFHGFTSKTINTALDN